MFRRHPGDTSTHLYTIDQVRGAPNDLTGIRHVRACLFWLPVRDNLPLCVTIKIYSCSPCHVHHPNLLLWILEKLQLSGCVSFFWMDVLLCLIRSQFKCVCFSVHVCVFLSSSVFFSLHVYVFGSSVYVQFMCVYSVHVCLFSSCVYVQFMCMFSSCVCACAGAECA